MVRKLKEIAAAKEARGAETQDGKQAENGLADTVRESAQQIWLAGLGAFAKAQQEGGKVFEALVREGKGLEQRTLKSAESAFASVAGQLGRKTDQVTAKATARWDKLEQVFEDRVARTLGRLGVPSQQDLQSLASRLEELAATVDRLSPGASAAGSRRATKSSRAAKTAKKRRGPSAASGGRSAAR